MWQNLKSKTTLAGILGSLALLFQQASYHFDEDPATKPSFEIILAALGVFGTGWFSSDRVKTP